MKIAVLLRGQMRYSKEGAHLFQKFVIEKFPQHEFDFFISTPKRVNYFKLDVNKPLAPRYNNVNLTLEEIHDRIKFWSNTKQYHIQSESEVFNVVKKIITELMSDTAYYEWWKYHNKKFNFPSDMMDFTAPPIDDILGNDFKTNFSNILYKNLHPDITLVTEDDKTIQLQSLFNSYPTYYNIPLCNYAISLHNIISQYYSFARSFKVLKDYMKRDLNYVPDLVWSTRPDTYHTFEGTGDKFESLKNQVDSLSNFEECNSLISMHVYIRKNQAWVHDGNFFSNVKMLDNILDLDNQSCEDILLNAMTRGKLNLTRVKYDSLGIQHIMWAAIFNNACFYQANAFHQQHETNFIRHTYDLSAIHNMTGSTDDSLLLDHMHSKFKYPDNMQWWIDDETIIKEFEYLSLN